MSPCPVGRLLAEQAPISIPRRPRAKQSPIFFIFVSDFDRLFLKRKRIAVIMQENCDSHFSAILQCVRPMVLECGGSYRVGGGTGNWE